MNPVAPKAQKKVPLPEGLDLEAWINDPPSESEDEEVPTEVFVKSVSEFYGEKPESKHTPKPTEEELSRVRILLISYSRKIVVSFIVFFVFLFFF